MLRRACRPRRGRLAGFEANSAAAARKADSSPGGAGTLVLGLDGIPTSVNLILDNNQRKGFASGEIFMSHGYKWQRIISGNSGDQALFTVNGFDFAPGTLVKVRNNPRSPVYLVYPNRVIRAFTDYDTFQAMGYSP
jgi:hypothetical protein